MDKRIRNDGKAARTPRLRIPTSRHNGSSLAEGEQVPMWEQLVQPGPKGFPARTHERRAERGQVVTLTRTPAAVPPRPARQGGSVRLGTYSPLRTRKAAHHEPSERIRLVKGSRTEGLVEVRRGNARERMAQLRQRPVHREVSA